MGHSSFNLAPSRKLYNAVRGGFVSKGTTLSKFCKSIQVNPQNALTCLIGSWNGPKAQKLRAQLIEASGITNNPISNAADHTTPAAAAITTPEAFAYWGC